jgi:plasmid stabilization system protein ParE
MRYTVTIAHRVIDQLDRQEQYIAIQASPLVAKRYMDGLFDFLSDFDTFPERGHLRDDLLPGLRISGYKKSATVAVVVHQPHVYVVGVFFGGEHYDDVLSDLDMSGIAPP